MHYYCSDWVKFTEDHPNVLYYTPTYGWVLSWLELSNEGSHYKTHNYGIPISFCPFCGKSLTE